MDAQLIYDVGLYHGRDTAYYLHRGYRVVAIEADPLLAEHGVPHYLKIDIEGADALCLDALSGDDLPQYVSIEAHKVAYLHQLQTLGYDRFKLVNQLDHNDPRSQSIEWRRPAVRLQRNLRRAWHDLVRWTTRRQPLAQTGGLRSDGTWVFGTGSSGPFGEDTPGPWRSLEDVAADITAWSKAAASPDSSPRKTDLNPRGWYDFHATRR